MGKRCMQLSIGEKWAQKMKSFQNVYAKISWPVFQMSVYVVQPLWKLKF